MRAGASALLATGKAALVDLVTLTVPRHPYVGGIPPVGQTGTATILGETYQTIIMPDGKEWLAENLRYTGNGVDYELNPVNRLLYGRLYNVGHKDAIQALIADGWRVALRADWEGLCASVGGSYIPGGYVWYDAGGPLKSTGTAYWDSPNTGATDAYGLGIRGGGYYKSDDGNPWYQLKIHGLYWCGDGAISGGRQDIAQAYFSHDDDDVQLWNVNSATRHLSIRLVRDMVPTDLTPVEAPCVIRWTSHDRPLRFQGAEFQGLPGSVWTRGGRSDQAGSEVSSLTCSVAGDLVVPWRTHPTDTAQVDLIDLSELAVLGLLEGATLQIDEAVLDAFPSAPAGEAAAELPIDQVTTAVVLGEVVEASLDALSVSMRVRSVQHRGGATVPRAVFAPTCRWDFAGPECGYDAQWTERTALETTEESIRLSSLQAEDFGTVVPLEGRNMGIRRTLGVGQQDGLERVYALPEPWPWPMEDNTAVAVGFECSKGFSSLTGRPSCTMLLRQAQFGGFAGMPPPEGS